MSCCAASSVGYTSTCSPHGSMTVNWLWAVLAVYFNPHRILALPGLYLFRLQAPIHFHPVFPFENRAILSPADILLLAVFGAGLLCAPSFPAQTTRGPSFPSNK